MFAILILQVLILQSGDDIKYVIQPYLNDIELSQMKTLVSGYAGYFAFRSGGTELVKYHIDTGGNSLIRQLPQRFPCAL